MARETAREKFERWLESWPWPLKKGSWQHTIGKAAVLYDPSRGWLNLCVDCGSVFISQYHDGTCYECQRLNWLWWFEKRRGR